MKIKLIIFTIFLLMLSSVHALEYSVTVNSPSSVNAYEGDKITNKFSAALINNAGVCVITCGWATTAGQDSGIKVAKEGGKNTFNFDVNAVGSSGTASYSLVVTCDRISAWNCWSDQDQRTLGPYQFRFLWNGDGICTSEREKCENYNQFLKDNSCSCQSGKECRPNGNRNDLDEKGCQTYCGNNIVEKQYEKCNDCPDDVGKCDGLQCFTGSECEGKFCVHNKCSRLAYIIGDGYCDTNVGENCNSKQDCPCESNTHCEIGSPNADYKGCATWCGNNVCEASEQRICKADCNWCGDGTCESSESCSSCDVDFGVCKKATKEEELQRNTQTKDVKTKQTTQTANLQTGTSDSIKNEQKTVSLFGKNYNLTVIVVSAIALIVLLGAVSFFIYKKIKSNKKDKHHAEKKHHEPKVTRCHKCNKKIDEDTKFCPHCGHKIE